MIVLTNKILLTFFQLSTKISKLMQAYDATADSVARKLSSIVS